MDAATLNKRMKKVGTVPSLWTKCPKCHNLVYVKEVIDSNKCPEKGCGHVYPYPFAKIWELNELLKTGSTYGEFTKLVLNTLDSLKGSRKKVAFLSRTYGIFLSNFEWQQMQKKKKK